MHPSYHDERYLKVLVRLPLYNDLFVESIDAITKHINDYKGVQKILNSCVLSNPIMILTTAMGTDISSE